MLPCFDVTLGSVLLSLAAKVTLSIGLQYTGLEQHPRLTLRVCTHDVTELHIRGSSSVQTACGTALGLD